MRKTVNREQRESNQEAGLPNNSVKRAGWKMFGCKQGISLFGSTLNCLSLSTKTYKMKLRRAGNRQKGTVSVLSLLLARP